MRSEVKVILEEHEIGALDMLGDIDCPVDFSIPQCPQCPFHLNGDIILSTGRNTSCLSLLCKDMVRKNQKENRQ